MYIYIIYIAQIIAATSNLVRNASLSSAATQKCKLTKLKSQICFAKGITNYTGICLPH